LAGTALDLISSQRGEDVLHDTRQWADDAARDASLLGTVSPSGGSVRYF